MKVAAKWLAAFFIALLVPFLIVIGSNLAIAFLVPGEVTRESWANVSKIVFLIGIPVLLIVTIKSDASRWLRWPLGVFGTLLLVTGIWYFQFTPLCGSHIGEKVLSRPTAPPIRIASC